MSGNNGPTDDGRTRCGWSSGDPIMTKYHDLEWGVPVHDDRKLYEFIVLEGAQAGLSWITVLKKREAYRKAFEEFDFNKVANFDDKVMEKLLEDKGIIRNKLKIRAAILNARALLSVRDEFASFDEYLWQFSSGKTIKNAWHTLSQIPSRSDVSDRMSKDLVRRGFKFVGTTICYAHMQATGMVNDHLVSCFRYYEI